MLPRWKLIRELERLKGQLWQIPWYLYGPPHKALHDLRRQQRLEITAGQQELGDDLAILLIFQPKGVLKSTLDQIDYLTSQGISALVVSNAPLSKTDLSELTSRAYRVMQRPNYGHDFGGYRDGILHFLEMGIRPRNLFIINDSIWFPVTDGADLIKTARLHPADLYGISYAKHARKPYLNHIQSYFLRFNQKTVSNPFFETYWRTMPVSSNRYTVIRKCEMGLTNAFRSRGFSVGCLYDFDTTLDRVLSLSPPEFEEVIAHLIEVESSFKDMFAAVKNGAGKNWQEDVKELLVQRNTGIPFLTLHPRTMLTHLKSPILKKDRKGPYKVQRAEIRRLGLMDHLSGSIAEEIRDWDSPQ